MGYRERSSMTIGPWYNRECRWDVYVCVHVMYVDGHIPWLPTMAQPSHAMMVEDDVGEGRVGMA